jgi:glycosyltransferase involved in cell wall biosynthesis
MYPGAPIHTSLYAPDVMPESYRTWPIRRLWTDRLPGIHRHHQAFLPFYPMAWGGLDLSAFDVVLSNKSGFCHGFCHGRNTLHVCYCLAPTRYVWQLDEYLKGERVGPLLASGLLPMIPALRRWDYAAARRVDRFIAISGEIQQRIRKYYDRESVIIHPPVDTGRFRTAGEKADFFLVVSRLIPYKRIDLAVAAATRLGVKLKVCGTGRDMERLRRMAGPTVEFLGFVDNDVLPALMASCRALIFPGLEDFGITPVQAQAAGRPVIAYGGGGALDTVIPGQTGELFRQQTVDSLAEVMARFDDDGYDPGALRSHANRFDTSQFTERMRKYVATEAAGFAGR